VEHEQRGEQLRREARLQIVVDDLQRNRCEQALVELLGIEYRHREGGGPAHRCVAACGCCANAAQRRSDLEAVWRKGTGKPGQEGSLTNVRCATSYACVYVGA